jgi:hypothetical protein
LSVLPRSPLPRSPLPRSPLPGSPLPGSPLPGSPLSGSPLSGSPVSPRSSELGPASTLSLVSAASTASLQAQDQEMKLYDLLEQLVNDYELKIGSKETHGKPGQKHPLISCFERNVGVEILFRVVERLKRGSRFAVPSCDQKPKMRFTDNRAITANAKNRLLSLGLPAIFQLNKLAKDDSSNLSQKALINKQRINEDPLLKKWFLDMKEVIDSLSFDRLKMIAGNDTEMLNAINDLEEDFNNYTKPYFKAMTDIELEPSKEKQAIMKIQTGALEKFFQFYHSLKQIDKIIDANGAGDELKSLNSAILESFKNFINELDRVSIDDSELDLKERVDLSVGSDSSPISVYTPHPCGFMVDVEKEMPLNPISDREGSINFLAELQNFLYTRNILSKDKNIVSWHGGDLDRTDRDAVALYAVRLYLAVDIALKESSDEKLKNKLLNLALELMKITEVLSLEYKDALESLGSLNAPLTSKYNQHLGNLAETKQCIKSQLGQLQGHFGTSSSEQSLGDISTSFPVESRSSYDSLIDRWENEFNKVIVSNPDLGNKLRQTLSQGRLPAAELLGVIKAIFPEINWDSRREVQEFYEKLNDSDCRDMMAKKINDYLAKKDPKILKDKHMIRAIKIFKNLFEHDALLDVILADFSQATECMAALCLTKILGNDKVKFRLLFEDVSDVKNAIKILNEMKEFLHFESLTQLSELLPPMFAQSDMALRGGIAAQKYTDMTARQLSDLGVLDIQMGRGSTPERGDTKTKGGFEPALVTLQPGRAIREVHSMLNPNESSVVYRKRILGEYLTMMENSSTDQITSSGVEDQIAMYLHGVSIVDKKGFTVG